ncbi:hypothetical protein V6R21_24910 [Limibacter armeniacum]|uniref:hypothetical protein n=1 Tax=Limibacter armeniacum TaxID=466084 RepID=UPI002FE612F1
MRIKYLDGGLGVVADRKRKLRSGKEYEHLFPKPNKLDPYLKYNGDTYDTIAFMEDIVRKTLPDTKGIAAVLQGDSLKKTSQNIFDFIYRHIQYKPDKATEEELRRPARSWADRKTGVDCDCYSIFISSVLHNLGIPHAFRKTKYYGRSYFQHIYVIVPKQKGLSLNKRENYITIDPVLDHFDQEKPFSQKHDRIMIPSPLALNGFPSGLGGLEGMPIRYLDGLRGSIPEHVYYSTDAANYQRRFGLQGAVYFDGVDYYEPLLALNGQPQLGFLKKLKNSKFWQKAKSFAGKVVKVATPLVASIIPGGGAVMNVASNLLNKDGSQATQPQLTPVSTVTPAVQAQAALPIPKGNTAVEKLLAKVEDYKSLAGKYRSVLDAVQQGKGEDGKLQMKEVFDIVSNVSKGVSHEEVMNLSKAVGVSAEDAQKFAALFAKKEVSALEAKAATKDEVAAKLDKGDAEKLIKAEASKAYAASRLSTEKTVSKMEKELLAAKASADLAKMEAKLEAKEMVDKANQETQLRLAELEKTRDDDKKSQQMLLMGGLALAGVIYFMQKK